MAIAIAALVWFLVGNAVHNVERRHLTTGFDFLWSTAGFDIDDTLIAWSPSDIYGRALLVGVLNTMLVAIIGVIGATALGLMVALMRISGNPLANGIARGLVEFVRNTPELVQIIFWYFAILQPLPPPKQSLQIANDIFLNVRGLYLPRPVFGDGGAALQWGLAAGLVIAIGLFLFRKLLPRACLFYGLPAILIALPVFAITIGRVDIGWDFPRLQGFNFIGGLHLSPEFIAMVLGVSVYSSAFIAEIIRAGILGVDRGQVESARSLGLRDLQILRLVIIPQALRIIVPPLTSQYVSLTKGTSLAVAIAYPDIVQIFAGVVLNQTGQAIEIMMITMAIYLSFSLFISYLMNLYNRQVTLVKT